MWLLGSSLVFAAPTEPAQRVLLDATVGVGVASARYTTVPSGSATATFWFAPIAGITADFRGSQVLTAHTVDMTLSTKHNYGPFLSAGMGLGSGLGVLVECTSRRSLGAFGLPGAGVCVEEESVRRRRTSVMFHAAPGVQARFGRLLLVGRGHVHLYDGGVALSAELAIGAAIRRR
jgi:hypothetical protein